MKEKITFSVQMTAKEVYKFTMYHVYHGFSGMFGMCISFVAFVLLLTNFEAMAEQTRAVLVLVAAWFILIDPIVLFSRSRGQVKRNKVYQKPLDYQLDASGITVSQDDVQQTIAWENLIKIVETKSQYLVYSSKVHAFIFPKEAVGDERQAMEEMLQQYAENTGIRLKGAIKKRNNSKKEG